MKLTLNQRRLLRIIIGAAVYAAGIFYKTDISAVSPALFLAAFIIIGGDIVLKAVGNIFRGQVFDENLLMSIAAVGAFAVGQYAEGAAVMLFYQVGELFQSYAVDKSRRSIASLMDIRPDYANVLREKPLKRLTPTR
jgi:Cd2+/Zn2+-exporting ATPase